MKRPKFRVWDKEEQKWYVPTYKAYKKELHDIDINLDGSLSIRTFDESGKYVTIHESMFEGRYELLQSTGLFDKNGKEIFIGDILEWELVMGFGWYENGKDVVIYDEKELKIKMSKRDDYSLNRVVGVGCKVVGNKFEHPHLLEEE